MIWKIAAAVLAAGVVALAIPAARHLREVPPPPPPMTRAQLAVPGGLVIGSGADPLDAAIAPDEQQIAFVATRDGISALWVQTLATGETRMLARTEGATLPAWSRDGQRLAFFAQGKLQTLDVGNGAVTAVADAPAPRGAAWRGDGALAWAAADGTIQLLRGGQATAITRLADGDVSHEFPYVDEVGRLVYVAVRTDGARVVRILAAPGGDAAPGTDLTQTSGHAELLGGFLVHLRDNVLLAQRLDERGAALVGRSLAMATGVGRSATGHGYFAASRRMALWAPAVPRRSELVWFDGAGQRDSVAAEPGDYWQVRLSPDERQAALTVLDPLLRTLDVFAIPLASPGDAVRVSLGIGPDSDPVWSPDGLSLLYRSLQGGRGVIMSRPASRSSAPESLVFGKEGVDVTPSDWRGPSILAHAQSTGRRRVVTRIDAQSRNDTALTAQGFDSWDARVSPDGRWVAYTADESGGPEVYVQAWPSPASTRVRATFGGGERPQWGPGGTLYFRRGDAIMRATLSGTPTPTVSVPQPLFSVAGLRDFAASSSNRMLVIADSTPPGAATTPYLIFDWAGAVPPPPLPVPKL